MKPLLVGTGPTDMEYSLYATVPTLPRGPNRRTKYERIWFLFSILVRQA